MPRVEKLVLEKFRGATQRLELEFDSKKRLALIFGENGTGKSTLVDALDMVGNSKPGSLEDRSSTSPYSQFLPTIGCKAAQMTVQAWFAGHVWEAKFSGSNIRSSAQTTGGLQTPPNIRILRRAKLLDLIEAQPAKRYEALKQFIDVNGVETAESRLSTLVTALNNEFNIATRDYTNAASQLNDLWQAEGSQDGSYRTWAQNKSSVQVSDLNDRKMLLAAYVESIARADVAKTEYDTAAEECKGIASEHEQARLAIEQHVAAENANSSDLVELLEKAKEVLATSHTSNDCPLCRQNIDHSQLLADVALRLGSMNALQSLTVKLKSVKQRQATASHVLQQKENSLVQVAQDLFKAITNATASETSALLDDMPNLQDASLETQWAVPAAINLIAWAVAKKTAITSERENVERDLNQLNAIKQQYATLTNTEKTSNEKQVLTDKAKKALDVVRQARIKYTQKILDTVAAECNRLYAVIHPNESIAISSLRLDPDKKASLLQGATFGTSSDVPPQAYFSESHLDTLGFCFWLAVVKHENPDGQVVIVLDDIFTSVDAAHIGRISDLLADESKHFAHIIITTHSRNWRDYFKLGNAPGLTTQLIELQRWTHNRGVFSFNSKLAVEELEHVIQSTPFDRQAVASKSGVLLEAVLDSLALRFGRPLPRKPNTEYTLGELTDACQKLFKQLQNGRLATSQEGLVAVINTGPSTDVPASPPPVFTNDSIQPQFEKIFNRKFIRNKVGAHFNLDGLEISDSEVDAFGNDTVALFRAVSCHACGQIPNKRAGTHWECGCKAMRLLPLELV